MAVFWIVPVVLAIFVLYDFLSRYCRMRHAINRINGPRCFPIFGHIPLAEKEPAKLWEQLCGVAGLYDHPRLARIWLMWYPYVLIYGADEAEQILGSHEHINKGREYEVLHPWMGLGLLTSSSEKWRNRRKLLTPTFHYDILKDFVHVFNEYAKSLLKIISDRFGQSTFDPYTVFTLCTLDVICESAMGRSVNATENADCDYVKAIHRINRIIHKRQREPWMWNDLIFNWFGDGKEHDHCLKIVHAFTEKVIQERKAEAKKYGSVANMTQTTNGEDEYTFQVTSRKRRLAFLDLLLAMAEKGNMTDLDIREEVDTFMFEGHDTTAIAMCWALHLIGHHPDIQEKIHQEVDANFGDSPRDVAFEDLKNLHYLDCCIREALRLNPSVPLFARRIDKDWKIFDYEIPTGTQLLVCPYMVHRDPKFWPDPEVYDPDRFLPHNVNGRHPFAYLPFSAGYRNCIGQRFAMLELKTFLSWVFRYFVVTSMNRRDQIQTQAELILRPKDSILIKLKLRRPIDF